MDQPLSIPTRAIAQLPPECLEIVLGFLRYDLASLHRLLFVSRQFFQLTVPVLYESPFRLAAGIRDPFSASSSSTTSYQPSAGHANDTASGWARLLQRTKLLSRLLIQNLQISHLGRVSRSNPQRVAIQGDSTGLENLEPLLPPTDHPVWSRLPPPLEVPSDWTRHVVNPTLGSGIHDDVNFGWGNDEGEEPAYEQLELSAYEQWEQPVYEQREQPSDQCPDLISFDDGWNVTSTSLSVSALPIIDQAAASSSKGKERQVDGVSNNSKDSGGYAGTGLLLDYFHFYTQHDHWSITSVIREIYPGAGRREYDKYMAEIERAILEHNPGLIESIHIQTPNVVVPHLQANVEKFEQLRAIGLSDSVWTVQELAMVHQFLKDHSKLFPASIRGSEVPDDDEYFENEGLGMLKPSVLQRDTRRQAAAVRNIKYSTSRSHWDDARLEGVMFDPVQLMRALGPGLETIDSVYWPRTKPVDLEPLDVSSLRSLKIGFVVTPHEDLGFSRPEFLSRCRQLHNLEMFSSSKDMFAWAVEDWNKNRKNKKDTIAQEQGQGQLPRWIKGVSYPIVQKPRVRKPVQLRHLRIHGPTDQIVYDILRDSFYAFRETLQTVEARSDMEYIEGEAEWMDHAQQLLSGQSGPSESRRASNGAAGDIKNEHHESAAKDVDDEECYNSLSSITSGPLLIRWDVPCLTVLDLTGPIAANFNVGSLRHMPNLRTVCFAITVEASDWLARGHSYKAVSDLGHYGGGLMRYDLAHLPMVAPRSVRRVLLRGPWPEITDQNLQKMIDTIPAHSRIRNGGSEHSSSVENHDNNPEDVGEGEAEEDDGRWGSQLFELSILDNPRVTVPGMIRLARQMDRLQVMGMSLNLISSHQDPFSSDIPPSPDYPFDEPFGDDHLYTDTSWGHSQGHGQFDDPETAARKMVLRAHVEMPWVDLGPEANHLARRAQRDGYLSRGWNI